MPLNTKQGEIRNLNDVNTHSSPDCFNAVSNGSQHLSSDLFNNYVCGNIILPQGWVRCGGSEARSEHSITPSHLSSGARN